MAASGKLGTNSVLARLRSESRGLRGARARASAPRYLASAALFVLVALGLRSLVWMPSPAPSLPPSLGADAPSEDFALQFARAYLTYDSGRPEERNRALAPYLSEGMDAAAGFFAPSGSQRVGWAEIASEQPALAGGWVITIAASVSTQRLPVYLAITVSHRPGSGLALVGYPALVGAPTVSDEAPTPSRLAVDEPALKAVVERVVRNYLAASAPNLKADLTADAAVTLPTLSLRVRSVDRVEWLGGAGSAAVLVALTAADSRGASYALAYELGIAYRERPYVDFIEVVPTAS